MSTMQFNSGAYQAEGIAIGAAVGVGMFAIVGAIASVIQARQMMAELERRKAEWENPGLIYQPIRREFVLAQLSEIDQYLFHRLPSEIETLRKINIDLHRITAEPFAVFDAIKERIMLAAAGLHDDAKAVAFASSVDQVIPNPVPFDPSRSPLHQPITGLDLMRRQHDWMTKSIRGPVYGGSYEQPSDQRDKSGVAMWREIIQGKEAMENIAEQLVEENKQIADDLEFVQSSFGGLIAFYQIAVAAYNEQADEAAVKVFADLIEIGDTKDFGQALAAASEIAAKESVAD